MSLKQETEYTVSLAWADVKPGMTVQLRHPKCLPRVGEVELAHNTDLSEFPTYIAVNAAWYHNTRGWSLWVKPELVGIPDKLPTEPGLYVDSQGDIASDFTPFTRLLTEAEWEAKRGERHADLIAELLRLASRPAQPRDKFAMLRAAEALANTPKASKP